MLQRDGVEVAVFLVGPSGATLLGSSSRLEERPHSDDQIVSEVVSAVQRCVAGDRDGHADATADADDTENATGDKSIAWASAFLQVLCHVKKYIARRQADEDFVKQRGDAVPTRILAIVSSSDPSTSKYLPFMNGFFAAQRDKIVVDCCDLDSHASTEALFRQGCLLTSGFYLKPTNPEALLEYLMTAFVADASSREYLRWVLGIGPVRRSTVDGRPPSLTLTHSHSCFARSPGTRRREASTSERVASVIRSSSILGTCAAYACLSFAPRPRRAPRATPSSETCNRYKHLKSIS